MICWALSGLSQKFGWPICEFKRSRWESLPGTSKTVPELGQAVQDLIGTAAKISVHETPLTNGTFNSVVGPGSPPTTISNKQDPKQFGLVRAIDRGGVIP